MDGLWTHTRVPFVAYELMEHLFDVLRLRLLANLTRGNFGMWIVAAQASQLARFTALAWNVVELRV